MKRNGTARSWARIDRANEFLVQPLGEGTSFDQTVQQLCDITESWDFLLPDANDAAGEKANEAAV